jgi:chromosome segregation ATPase
MKRIREEEKLDEWADDSLQWLQDTFGKENIVSAVLHGDETTSHVHAALIPIVTGERRKADKERADKAQTGKKTYRKKSTNTVRLCADDVLTRDKMKDYQTSYAERMAKYGLERGVEGSKARYKTTQEYYRELYLQQQTLKEDIGKKERQKSDIEQQYTRLSQQADEKTRELEETRQTFDETKQKLQKEKQAVKTAEIKTKITGTVSSLLGTPKCRQLEQEVESLRHTIEEKEESYQNLMQQNEKREQEYQNHIRQLQKLHADKIREKESESSQLQKISKAGCPK